jgi:hypothetical protein
MPYGIKTNFFHPDPVVSGRRLADNKRSSTVLTGLFLVVEHALFSI